MNTPIITTDVWKTLTASAKAHKGKSSVAVAYFGNGASTMLPLRQGSNLVVDASERAVKCGQTSPAELIKLYKKGINIFSCEDLHAKVYIFGSRLFIGSCNVSQHSSQMLEAVFTSSNKRVVKEAKKFVESLCLIELGPEHLKRLKTIYKPPVFPAGKKTSSSKANSPKFHIFWLTPTDYTEGYEQALKEGTAKARKKKSKKHRHILEEFEWPGKVSAKEGDIAMQITQENGKQLVSPPGYIKHIEKWKNKNKTFVFVEVPVKRRRNIKSMYKNCEKKELDKSGKKNKQFGEKVLREWA